MTEDPEAEGLPPTSWTVLDLPRSHWHCHLDNFNWQAVQPPQTRVEVERFTESVITGEAPHLFLTGREGLGKSHIGVGVYRRVVAAVGTGDARWINVPKFCDLVKRGYGAHTDPWPEYEDARRLVVLDDLLARDFTSHEIGQVIYRLIDLAYLNGAAVLITMNPSVEELTTHLRRHEVSRLLASARVLPLRGTDHRLGAP